MKIGKKLFYAALIVGLIAVVVKKCKENEEVELPEADIIDNAHEPSDVFVEEGDEVL